MAGAVLLAASAHSAAQPAPAGNYLDLSIEELMAIPITSVSRKETRLQDSAAAISVLTSEDIRRIGATSLPEALRLVPGLEVLRVNASQYALTSRGFNNQYANKLLVSIDGRTVYTPSFSGVYWVAHQPMLEDLERIEVIRGPGATLWGANAVNGVINVTSKSARDTQGGLFNVVYGDNLQPLANVRSGVELAPNLYARVYGQFTQHDDLSRENGTSAGDGWRDARAGARLDWHPGDDELTVQAEYHAARVDQVYDAPVLQPFARMVERQLGNQNRGAHVLGRWTRRYSATSRSTLQAYVDWFRHRDVHREERLTADIDWQHRFAPSDRHDVVWGAGIRYSPVEVADIELTTWLHGQSTQRLFSAFVQDEITFGEKTWSLTPGVKFEHNELTGLEIQPSVRLRWTPHRRHTLWGAVSRAVRTPGVFNHSARSVVAVSQPPASPPIEVAVFPNPDLAAETLVATELGYRVEAGERLALEVALFHHTYRHFMAIRSTTPPFLDFGSGLPRIVAPLATIDSDYGYSYGVEISAQWRPTDNWRLMASYSGLELRMNPPNAAGNGGIGKQFRLQSAFDVTRTLEFNATAHFTDGMNQSAIRGQARVPAHTRIDAGVTWRPRRDIELSVWAQDIADTPYDGFPNYRTSFVVHLDRSVWGKITLRF